ncbi:antibiotic biosynthesis monooxygenase family protein [Pseudomonas gingeri]
MPIVAVNTVHIRLNAGEGSALDILQALASRLGESTGCLGYGLTPCPQDQRTWILAGYWASEAQMNAHFSSAQMISAINRMVESRAYLGFACFCLPVLGG